jgi:uncharacterized membrane protein YdjX (TVP38/TMEM64 family)
MRTLFRNILLIALVLLVPIIPFLLCGDQLESWFQAWFRATQSRPRVALAIVAILSTDVLLPVPSSFVSTFGGSQLGTWWGTCASWLGMSIGAALGFALARWLGPPFVRRLSQERDLASMEAVSDRYGPLLLVLARGIPVFAEASVLLMGMHQLTWRRFLPVVLASNLGIAWAYSALGTWAAEREWLPIALGVSVALPFLWTLMARRWMPCVDQRGSEPRLPCGETESKGER